jgi:hypothetical protein
VAKAKKEGRQPPAGLESTVEKLRVIFGERGKR